MQEDFVAVWDSACGLMRENLSGMSYDTWIKPLKPVGMTSDTLILEIDTVFHKNTISSRYGSMIRSAIRSVAGPGMDFGIYLEEELHAQARKKPPQSGMNSLEFNPKYTFESFVVGSSNRMAHAASLAVAESPADNINPLFLYGGVGLGKTHLLHAIGNYMKDHNPTIKLLYITSESFTNELIQAIKSNRTDEFRERFRSVDVLMVDDVQFIAGKDSTQEEFFHTFNHLHDHGKQIVLASDRPPKDIKTLEERLRSRFEWGMLADLGKPDYETRVAILQKKSDSEHLSVEHAILEYIAENIESNIRELDGALNQLAAFARLSNRQIDMALAREALADIFQGTSARPITVDFIMETVAGFYNITVEDLQSARRSREVAQPRQTAMYLTRKLTGLSLPKIGEAFGGRDHTTVIHAFEKVTEQLEENGAVSEDVAKLEKLITRK